MKLAGYDTLKIHLIDYEIKKGNITVDPCSYNRVTGEQKGGFLYKDSGYNIDVEGKKAHLNTPTFNLTATPERGIFVEKSIPKIINDNNTELLNKADTKKALLKIEYDLADNGIYTNILNQRCSRVDMAKNGNMDNVFSDYRPLFTLLQGERKDKRDYGTTFLWYNTMRQICAYDKGLKNQSDQQIKKSMQKETNDLRIEARLLKASSCKKVGFMNVSDLLTNYDSINDIYRGQVASLFQTNFKNHDIIPSSDIVQLQRNLEKARGKFGTTEIKDILSIFGMEYMINQRGYDIPTYTNVMTVFAENKNKRQQKKRLMEYFTDLYSFVNVNGCDLSDLQQEIYQKFIAA